MSDQNDLLEEQSRNELFGRAREYREARGLIGITKLVAQIAIFLGLILSVIGLFALFASESIFPASLFINRVLIGPGLLVIWMGLNSLSAAQVRQASLDNAEASIAMLKIMSKTSRKA